MPDEALDGVDTRLLQFLQENGRASNQDLTVISRMSPAQTNRRHRRLEEQGYIRRYEARLDAARLGIEVVAFVHVTMERGHVREVAAFKAKMLELGQVQECYSVSGDSDYVVKVVAASLKALSEFLMSTLMRMPGVASVRSSVCLDEIKCTSALPLSGP